MNLGEGGRQVRLVVDAMGGDHKPQAPVQGAMEALAAVPDLEILLAGRPEVIGPVAAEHGRGLDGRWEILPASEVIGPEEAPAQAVKSKRDSSIVVGLDACASGRADGMVSAGNTGALTTAGLLRLHRIPGVARPAMPVVLPTVDRRGLILLDIGAGADADAQNLLDYGIMGSLYAEKVRDIARPRVALLNIGTEERKGTRVSREAFALLQDSPLNFVGNIEGRELFGGKADVVVTDGFVGNVVIKTLEGFAWGISQVMGHDLRHSGIVTLIGAALAARTLRNLRKRIDYTEYGGVPFLGINGVCVKCHGSSSVKAMRNGILAGARIIREGVVPEIARSVAAARGQNPGDGPAEGMGAGG